MKVYCTVRVHFLLSRFLSYKMLLRLSNYAVNYCFLSIYRWVSRSLYLYISLFPMALSLSLYVSLSLVSLCLSISLSLYLSVSCVSLSLCLSISLSLVSLCLSISLSLYLPVSCVSLSLYLSVSLSLYFSVSYLFCLFLCFLPGGESMVDPAREQSPILSSRLGIIKETISPILSSRLGKIKETVYH